MMPIRFDAPRWLWLAFVGGMAVVITLAALVWCCSGAEPDGWVEKPMEIVDLDHYRLRANWSNWRAHKGDDCWVVYYGVPDFRFSDPMEPGPVCWIEVELSRDVTGWQILQASGQHYKRGQLDYYWAQAPYKESGKGYDLPRHYLPGDGHRVKAILLHQPRRTDFFEVVLHRLSGRLLLGMMDEVRQHLKATLHYKEIDNGPD